MTGRAFPALGFDPAPGSPAVLTAQAREAELAARALAGAATAATRLDAGWQGDSAEAYRERARDLPRDLGHAAAAHRALARTLSAYADDLAGRQVRAAELERQAAAARHETAGALPDAGGQGAGADARLAAVVAAARRLRAEHSSAARAAADRIRAATDPPYQRPGVLSRLRGTVGDWVTRHADVLGTIARDLRGLSGVLGAVSLVPGFQFLAPVAIAAGAAAVALDVTVALATGHGDWSSLALDAGLTALPTGPVARAAGSVPGLTGALKAANRAVPARTRGLVFRAVRNLPEGISADQLAAAAARIRSGAAGLADDVVVQGSRAGHSARAGSDVDFGLRVAPDRYEDLIRECFGESAGEARANAVERGRIFWRRAGLKELHDALQSDLGRKVDLAIIKRGGRFDNEPWLPVR